MAGQIHNETSQYRKYYQRLEPLLAKPKNRAYSTAAFSLLAVSLFGWYAVRPTVQTILYLRREISDKIIVNQKMEEKITALIEAQAAYETVRPKLDIITQSMPGTPQIIDIVAQLRNLADFSSASVSSIQVPTVPLLGQDASVSANKAVAAPSKESEFPVSVILTGTYPALRTFLDGLIGMRRVVRVESITISPVRKLEVTSSPLLQLVLRVKTYYLKE